MSILVSACLLGAACRYDGEAKKNEKAVKLLEAETLIPVCPEQLGGMPTPRLPCEIAGSRVVSKDGKDMTKQYQKGAEETLKLAKLFQCSCAILKERSPSCGCGKIYDGSFSGKLVDGDGITARLLKEHGIVVKGESEL